MRPVVGSEFLLSRHLPDDVQGQFIYACVINMNGIPRFEIHNESAGLRGSRIMHPIKSRPPVAGNGSSDEKPLPNDLLASTDKVFRPVDPQIGPDGALWFGDWCNALIGHMQYSQRDPNRDHVRGRVYRLVAKNRPLNAKSNSLNSSANTSRGPGIAPGASFTRGPRKRSSVR
jgi:hypothetical protein